MMYGNLNTDILCRVLEQIFSEREKNVEVKVSLITEDKTEEIGERKDKTA